MASVAEKPVRVDFGEGADVDRSVRDRRWNELNGVSRHHSI